MAEQGARRLPLLERIALWVPGYGGYLDRANRRSADQALREAVADRLRAAKPRIEAAIRACVDRAALNEIAPLERAGTRLEHAIRSLVSAGSGTDEFYQGAALDAARAESLHAFDLGLLEDADRLVRRLESASDDASSLTSLDAELTAIEAKLAERANALRHIRP